MTGPRGPREAPTGKTNGGGPVLGNAIVGGLDALGCDGCRYTGDAMQLLLG
jgi:hypothetical protein